jgi:hypothetical protein
MAEPATHTGLFWLHVKKSAGITTRRLLQPHYVEVDRTRQPKNFAQASTQEYNDILNNYRVVLGDCQFKRCLFARDHLYGDGWVDLYSFAFAREPVDRVVSMFFYLYRRDTSLARRVVRGARQVRGGRRPEWTTSVAFDAFLDHVAEARNSDSVYEPLGLHFSTHTAAMWDDITDRDGRVLLTRVHRLEHLVAGVNEAFEAVGVNTRVGESVQLNATPGHHSFTPSRRQRVRIEELYGRDFEVYESAH